MKPNKTRLNSDETIKAITEIKDLLLNAMDRITEILKDTNAVNDKPFLGIHRGFTKKYDNK